MTRRDLTATLSDVTEMLRRKAKEHFRYFVPYLKDDYEMIWFHKLICNTLDEFEQGKIKKLMVFVPPQHGKTELTTRSFPPYLLGKNPERRIAVVTYNDTIANSFNRAIQRKMDCQAYLDIFPGTKLNDSKFHSVREADKQRNTDMIDILSHSGSIKTLGRGGSLTGFPVDIGIIDDPIKDRSEAQSETIREGLYSWYTDVFLTRLHNNSQQLLIQTRWHEHDLAGRILAKENDWVIIKLPAIKTQDEVSYDPREQGEALWPQRHSLAKIMDAKHTNEVTFNSLYQQDPKPNSQILVYKDWIEIPEWPKEITDVSWGLDFGKTTGINALVKGTVVSGNVRPIAYLKEYLYTPNIPAGDIAKVLIDNGYREGQVVWCDHIPTKINELRMLGISAYKAVKGPGSISAGIDKLNEYEVRYVGKNIRKEVSVYQYVTYDTLITNVPVDENNHILDATRYCLLSKFFAEGGNS